MYVKVKIANKTLNKILETQGIVDTGATLTVLPRKIASELGLKTIGSNIVETGTGKIKLDRSRAWLEIEGKSEIMPVLISDIIDKVLKGVTKLEAMNLKVNPITQMFEDFTASLYQRGILKVNWNISKDVDEILEEALKERSRKWLKDILM